MAVESRVLPWTKSCFVCGEDNKHGLGLKSRMENGCVVIDYIPRDCDRGWKHIMHGGLTITLMDEVMTWAAMLEVKSACVAAEINSRLKQPIEVGQPLRVEGSVSSAKSRMVLTEARVVDINGVVLASASGKYMKMATDKILFCKDDFVYDDAAIDPEDILIDIK